MREDGISRLEHCTERQLKKLLALAANDTKVVRDCLLDVASCDRLERLLGNPELLQGALSPETSVERLVAIKRAAKQLSARADETAHKAAANLLYHLSVACALAHHGHDISSKRSDERLALYRYLAVGVADDRLAAIFEKAATAIKSPK